MAPKAQSSATSAVTNARAIHGRDRGSGICIVIARRSDASMRSGGRRADGRAGGECHADVMGWGGRGGGGRGGRAVDPCQSAPRIRALLIEWSGVCERREQHAAAAQSQQTKKSDGELSGQRSARTVPVHTSVQMDALRCATLPLPCLLCCAALPVFVSARLRSAALRCASRRQSHQPGPSHGRRPTVPAPL